jgi:peptide/nickel transport system ATP-binding protein
VAELLQRVGLSPDHARRHPHQFSGGQRQRIAIARALALRPEVIICDEAVSALDVSIQAQVIDLLKELRREYGLSYIFIAHDLLLVRDFADRVLVMNRGKIVEQGTTEEVFQRPRDPYTRELIAASPIADPDQRTIGMPAGRPISAAETGMGTAGAEPMPRTLPEPLER